jgi:hypothetical protein
LKSVGVFFIALSAFVLLPALVFLAVHRWTAFFFRQNDVPLPFDAFGIAAGLGAASWTLAAAFWIGHKIHQRRRTP